MKTIFRIAKTELFTLFYSPVAWLILIIFAFQVNLQFTDLFSSQLSYKSLGYGNWNVTSSLFSSNFRGLFPGMLRNLYLYLPLLTMGLMSREIKSGSIKLLFSSPVTNTKIVLGKYLAMAIYCFMIIFILALPVLFCSVTVKDFDMPLALAGLLGIYLLICSYAAIGLFMSCLTSYQVVAAMGTLTILAALNFIGDVGQDIAFVRDITYWLSISGRAFEFIHGLICSEDLLYFLIVISLFVIFTVLKLNSGVQKRTILANFGRYAGVFLIAMLLGYVSSRPSMMTFYDATHTKSNTLTKGSQEVMEKFDDDLTIVTYVNLLAQDYYYGLPRAINGDAERFKQYTRFKPDIKMEYVYYYDKTNNPNLFSRYPKMNLEQIAQRVADINDLNFEMFMSPEEIRKVIDLRPEGNKFVRQLITGKGQKTWLRLYNDNNKFPNETEISAAIKRFVVQSPKVGFLTGHGEREINRNRDRDYSAFVNNRDFRNSMLNQGFDGFSLSLEGNNDIPSDVSVVVIADLREPLKQAEVEKLNKFIARGGNMIITGEPGRQEKINPFIKHLGVQLMSGSLVQEIKDLTPNIISGNLTKGAGDISFRLAKLKSDGYKIALPGTAGISYEENKGFKVTPLLVTNEKCSWNELETKDFLEEKTELNTTIGEEEKSLPAAVALSRKVGEKEQRIMIIGDTDFISNGELSRNRSKIAAANISFIPGMFEWMSYGKYPVDTRRPHSKDNDMHIGIEWAIWIKIFFMGIIPFLLAFSGCYIWITRKRN